MDNSNINHSSANKNGSGHNSKRTFLSSPASIAFIDALIIIGSGILTSAFFLSEIFSIYSFLLILSNAALTSISFNKLGLYQFQSIIKPQKSLTKLFATQFILLSSLLTFAFIFNMANQISRTWVIIWFISLVFMVITIRFFYVFIFEKWAKVGKFKRNIVIIGAEKHACDLIETIESRKKTWMHILGVYEDRLSRVPTKIGNNRVLGSIDDLISYAEENQVDDIIVALPWLAEKRVKEILKKLKQLNADIHLSPDMVSINFSEQNYSEYCGLPTLKFSESSF
ncbi:MAG: nucleoside-diphosphate sugar epimerase/dehydratase [Gammaproteobacteria bacterium]